MEAVGNMLIKSASYLKKEQKFQFLLILKISKKKKKHAEINASFQPILDQDTI